jgi:hypothetical protein
MEDHPCIGYGQKNCFKSVLTFFAPPALPGVLSNNLNHSQHETHTPFARPARLWHSPLQRPKRTAGQRAQGPPDPADGKKIEFQNLSATPEAYSFKDMAAGKYQKMPASSILRIEQQTGTEAGEWALYLGGAGLVGSLLGVLSAKSDATSLGGEVDDSKLVPIVLGLTAAAALIGAAIGSGQKKYRTVYDAPSKATTSTSFAPLRIKIASPAPRSIGIGLSLNLNYTGR